jgi:DNA recombination protein RmuC
MSSALLLSLLAFVPVVFVTVACVFQVKAERRKSEGLETKLAKSVTASEAVAKDRDLATTRAAVAEAKLATTAENKGSQEELLEGVRTLLQADIATLSTKALRDNNEAFTEMAKAKMELVVKGMEGVSTERKQEVEALVLPLGEALKTMGVLVRDVEAKRESAYGTVQTKVDELMKLQLRVETATGSLARSLRNPTTRGRWGELQLERTAELAGMSERCDFSTQVDVDTDDGKKRPDMVVHLSGGREIIVDSKVPLVAYLDAEEAENEHDRKADLKRHAKLVRTHIQALASKGYQKEVQGSCDLVVMFIPGESFYQAALQEDRGLLEFAAKAGVMVATPMSLIALLRIVAQGWSDQALAENAMLIREKGREVYDRLRVFAKHFAGVGTALDSSKKRYNEAVSSFDARLMPSARDLEAMDCAGSKQIKAPLLLTRETQLLKAASGNGPELATGGDGVATYPEAPLLVPGRNEEDAL